MPVTNIASPSTASAATPAATIAQSASKGLANNFDTFLKLLTVQMQNQDPLSPLDTNQFTQQLVSFTGVEQSIQQNKNLETLIAEMRGQSLNSSASYIGQDITADTDLATLGKNGTRWNYTLDSDALSNKLNITTERGDVVATFNGELKRGSYQFNWNGKLPNGTDAAPGNYRLAPKAKASDDSDVTSHVQLIGRVEAVEAGPNGSKLIVAGLPINLSQVLRITAPILPQNVVSSNTTLAQ
jgi:flagellar basal-body rod modification protein FlgD